MVHLYGWVIRYDGVQHFFHLVSVFRQLLRVVQLCIRSCPFYDQVAKEYGSLLGFQLTEECCCSGIDTYLIEGRCYFFNFTE